MEFSASVEKLRSGSTELSPYSRGSNEGYLTTGPVFIILSDVLQSTAFSMASLTSRGPLLILTACRCLSLLPFSFQSRRVLHRFMLDMPSMGEDQEDEFKEQL